MNAKLLTVRGFNALPFLGWLTRLFLRPPPLPAPAIPPPATAAAVHDSPSVPDLDPTPAGQRWEFRFASHLPGLAEFNAQLETCLERTTLSASDAFAMHLIFDELLTNVIKYAHPGDGDGHEIAVQFSVTPEHFEIRIQDDGVPFDPTTPPPVADAAGAGDDAPVDLEDRVVGGWGLSLVRKTADVFEYERCGGENRVRLLKHTAPETPPAAEAPAAPVFL